MVATFTDGTTTGVITKDIDQLAYKVLKVTIPTTFVWGTDQLVIDLTKYGCTKLLGFHAFEETTAGSVTIAATGTSSVSSGTATIVSTGSGANTCGGSFLLYVA
jgi:hypothetical protein